jgi:uncharacterized protein YgbK (DUF1537 family)
MGRSSLFILADDLTGAADAARYLNAERRRVRVAFAEAAPRDFTLREAIAEVFDTESRALSPDECPTASRSGDAPARLALRLSSDRQGGRSPKSRAAPLQVKVDRFDSV